MFVGISGNGLAPGVAPQIGQVQRITAAAATSITNAVALTIGTLAEFSAATDCRIRFGNAPVAIATDRLMISGAVVRWVVAANTNFIAIINPDFIVEGHVYPVSL